MILRNLKRLPDSPHGRPRFSAMCPVCWGWVRLCRSSFGTYEFYHHGIIQTLPGDQLLAAFPRAPRRNR